MICNNYDYTQMIIIGDYTTQIITYLEYRWLLLSCYDITIILRLDLSWQRLNYRTLNDVSFPLKEINEHY